MSTPLREYVVTLRIAAATDPADWEWDKFMQGNVEYVVAPAVSVATGQQYRVDEETSEVIQVNYSEEPEHLLGQWVNINFHGGLVIGGRLSSIDSEALTVVASHGAKPQHLARSAVKTITPGKDPKTK